jgi:hypothetical protein
MLFIFREFQFLKMLTFPVRTYVTYAALLTANSAHASISTLHDLLMIFHRSNKLKTDNISSKFQS